MKRPRGGSLFLLLTPDELLARIASLVPPPRSHALRYHGLFAPNARDRKRVVPPPPAGRQDVEAQEKEPTDPPGAIAAPAPEGPAASLPPGGFVLAPAEPTPERPLPRTRIPWAELLRRVFAVDVLDCPRCHGRLEIIAFIAEAAVARRILDHLGLEPQAPPLARARSEEPGGEWEPGPDCGESDPVYEE